MIRIILGRSTDVEHNGQKPTPGWHVGGDENSIQFFADNRQHSKEHSGLSVDADRVSKDFTRSEGVMIDGRKLVSIDFGFNYMEGEDFNEVIDGREVVVTWGDGVEIFRAKNPKTWDGGHNYPTVQWDGADREISDVEAYVELEFVNERNRALTTYGALKS